MALRLPPTSSRSLVWLVIASGCGPDLARLETEQQALEQEVAVLRKKVEEMRVQVKAMGVAPSGPTTDATAEIGGDDLAQTLRFTAERVGDPPALPPLSPPERRDATDCGFRIGLPWLEAISDQALEQTGSGRASPIVLFHAGRALTGHAGPNAYEKTCKFSFRHQPKYLFLSPEDSVENVQGTWTAALAPEVPLPRADDRPMYWTYPGTTLTLSFASGWDEAWGPMTVRLDARVLHVGTPEAPAPRNDVPATVRVLGFEQSETQPRLGFEHTPEPPTGPWTLEITSPSAGPYVLLETLVIGNADHSLVVTAEESK
ncbi:MAG: hypothetical protein ABMA64_15540 [Myxococcota bacterium]